MEVMLTCTMRILMTSSRGNEGTGADDKGIYGKWEATGVLPKLDACGGK